MGLVTIVIGSALFVGLLAILCLGYRARAENTEEEPGATHEHTAAPGGNECLLCHAPLPRFGTADEAVKDIERRIASDRREMAGTLAVRGVHRAARFDP